MNCSHTPRYQYPTEESMPGPGAFCDSCRRWVADKRPKSVSINPGALQPMLPSQDIPACGNPAMHWRDCGALLSYKTHNRLHGLITECACGGYTLDESEPAVKPKPKLDLERAQRSCFTKKGYGIELATKLANERGLRVYACNFCGRYHLTKQLLHCHT